MRLEEYNAYVRLYILAGDLDAEGLRGEVLDRLHANNKKMAAYLQRQAALGQVALTNKFKIDFAERARLTYEFVGHLYNFENERRIQRIFVELFEFAGYQPLGSVLSDLAQLAP